MTPIIEPRLDPASATAWYLICDPTQAESVVYGYLEGSEAPRIETREAVNADAVEFRVTHDFGAGVVDYRGLYKDPGANK
jgi:hypothetical protein